MRLSPLLAVLCYTAVVCSKKISRQERRKLVTKFNPTRLFDTSANVTTPMQVGNGNFAFGTDVTSLQTFLPFSIMSNWGWKTDAYPVGRTKEDIQAYKGVSWLNHGRPVQYDFGGPPDIEAWLRANPNRANLGRIGLSFWERGWEGALNVTVADLKNGSQTLDLWTGRLESAFSLFGAPVSVQTTCDPHSDTIAIVISSPLIKRRDLAFLLTIHGTKVAQNSAPLLWDPGTSRRNTPLNFRRSPNHAMASRSLRRPTMTYFIRTSEETFRSVDMSQRPTDTSFSRPRRRTRWLLRFILDKTRRLACWRRPRRLSRSRPKAGTRTGQKRALLTCPEAQKWNPLKYRGESFSRAIFCASTKLGIFLRKK